MKHRGDHRGATPSLRDYFAEYHRSVLIIPRQLRMIRCDNGHSNYAGHLRARHSPNFVRHEFLSCNKLPAATLITKLRFSTRDLARRPRGRLRGTRNRPGTKTRSSLNRLFTDRRTAHNICRVVKACTWKNATKSGRSGLPSTRDHLRWIVLHYWGHSPTNYLKYSRSATCDTFFWVKKKFLILVSLNEFLTTQVCDIKNYTEQKRKIQQPNVIFYKKLNR